MHISEGILSAPVLAAGAALTVGGLALGLRRVSAETMPRAGMLAAVFFVGSLVQVPLGPASVHLVLNGLAGLLLGWTAFPAIFVGLMLQAALFQFGGLTTLGINTFNLSFPAVLWGCCFIGMVRRGSPGLVFMAGFCCGALSVMGSGLLIGASLFLTGEALLVAAQLILLAHLPVMVVEGLLTGFCAVFLRQVKPEILKGWRQAKSSAEFRVRERQ